MFFGDMITKEVINYKDTHGNAIKQFNETLKPQLSKHIFEIDVERKEFASQLHNSLGDVMQTAFYPKLDILLEKYNVAEDNICYNRIDVNLNIIPEKSIGLCNYTKIAPVN